ncbi:hypothetical protein JAK71_19100 [Stenotrophomonas maltophilia]|nr:hypothetical protein [Stenotrophomonas maltophilia]
MALSLEEIRKKKADAEAQVAALEKAEQEAVAAEAGASFAGVYETLQQFGQWAETAEGKAWKKKHPDQEWPAHPFKA